MKHTQPKRAGHSREEAPAPSSRLREPSPLYRVRIAPVALEALAAAGGIEVFREDLGASLGEYLSRGVDGACVRSPNRPAPGVAILLNTRVTGGRGRFTFAHELAHAAHVIARPGHRPPQPQNRAGTGRNAQEQLCDRIAAEVLMPADLILSDVLEAGQVNSYALARRFGVSLTAMRVRLRGLGLL